MDYLIETNFQPTGFGFVPDAVWRLALPWQAKLVLVCLWCEHSARVRSVSLSELGGLTSLSARQLTAAVKAVSASGCDIPCAVVSDRGAVVLPVRQTGAVQ